MSLTSSNEGYPSSLELGKNYRVLPDSEAVQHGMLRVVDESGEDYLYPQEYFSEPGARPRREIPWAEIGFSAIGGAVSGGLLYLLLRERGRVKS